jgi:outer membrane protein OmpA-like peptidoglycan-associated protein
MHLSAHAQTRDRVPSDPNFTCPGSYNVKPTVFFSRFESATTRQTYHLILDSAAVSFKVDGSFLLLEGHVDLVEASLPGGDALDQRRVDYVEEQLLARGVPQHMIWKRRAGASQQVVVGDGPGAFENRRVVITPTSAGQHCRQRAAQRILSWARENCFPQSSFLDRVNLDPDLFNDCTLAVERLALPR